MRAKLKQVKEGLRKLMHQRIPVQKKKAGAGHRGVLQLLRRADQHAYVRRLPTQDNRPLATHAAAAQPEGSNLLGADGTAAA
jgi:hypothetical protein